MSFSSQHLGSPGARREFLVWQGLSSSDQGEFPAPVRELLARRYPEGRAALLQGLSWRGPILGPRDKYPASLDARGGN